MSEKPIELKNVDSMPGSINELISVNKRLRRPPSLSDSFAFSPENIARANLIPLISSSERLEVLPEESKPVVKETVIEPAVVHWKYEKRIVEVSIKLLLHIALISIFETLFYFLYVSTLEDNGIETTVNTFINGAANGCENMSQSEIQMINAILDPYINASDIISTGNNEELMRNSYNSSIAKRAWIYVGGIMGLLAVMTLYIRLRRIKINWKYIILENTAMVGLLALYELMFFNTIIYPYHPISTAEIGRNAVEKLQLQCRILE